MSARDLFSPPRYEITDTKYECRLCGKSQRLSVELYIAELLLKGEGAIIYDEILSPQTVADQTDLLCRDCLEPSMTVN